MYRGRQLEPPSSGHHAISQTRSIDSSRSGRLRMDPPDEGQSSSFSDVHDGKPKGRDPSVVGVDSTSINSADLSSLMRSAMRGKTQDRKSNQGSRTQRDPSIIDEPTSSLPTNPDPQKGSSGWKTRQTNPLPPPASQILKKTLSNGHQSSSTKSSASGDSSLNDSQSQQKAFLRNFLKKHGQKSSAPSKQMSHAKQKLLRNVLHKTQNAPTAETSTADSQSSTDSQSSKSLGITDSVRKKWKRVAAATSSKSIRKSKDSNVAKQIFPDHSESTSDQRKRKADREKAKVSIESDKPRVDDSSKQNKANGLSIRQRYEQTLRRKAFQTEERKEDFSRKSVDEEGYRRFLEILHQEVSGQHSQLWENFHALMVNRDPILVEPSPTPKSKTFKFDSNTKQLLMEMNVYLKDHSTVEHIGVTQLVKDKKFRQEQSRLSEAAGTRSNSNLSSNLPPILAERIQKREIEQAEAKAKLDATRRERKSSIPSTQPGDKAAENNAQARTIDHQVERRQGASEGLASLRKTDDRPVEIKSKRSEQYDRDFKDGGKVTNDQIILTRSESTVSVNHTIAQTVRMKSDSGNCASGTQQSRPSWKKKLAIELPAHDDETLGSGRSQTKEIPWQVKRKTSLPPGQPKSKISPTTNSTSSSPENSEVKSPWQEVQLRSVSSNSQPSPSPASAVSPEFANVRLRRVNSPTDTPTNASEGSPSASDHDPRRQVVRPNKTNAYLSPSESEYIQHQNQRADEKQDKSDDHPVSNLNSQIRSTQTQGFDSTDQSTVDEVVKPSDTSTTVTASASVGEVCVRLIPNENESKCEIIVGKQKLQKISKAHGTSQQKIAWELNRSIIKSVTLDMAGNEACLFLAEEGRSQKLRFPSSEDCLRFANSFYEFSAPSVASSSITRDIPENVDPADDDDEVSLLDTLNDEEQKVLETYRRLRKTRGRDDALQESISQQASTGGNQNTLTKGEQEQAEKYRGMLRMCFPLAVVKHKMTRDGASPKLFRIIESEATASPPEFVSAQALPTSPVSTFSSSCALSVTDLEAVETYRRLLKSQGDAESVRRKMTEDKAERKIFSCVFGEEEASTASSLTAAEESLVEGYRKMLKLSVPEEAVRHKMAKDGVSTVVVDTVFQPTQSLTLTKAEEAIAAKYKKMLSMGVEKDGVRHKMMRDQVGQKVISHVLELQPTPSLKLSQTEEAIAAKYKRMLSMGVEKDGVRHKMMRDQVAQKLVEYVLGSNEGRKNEPQEDPKSAQPKSDLSEAEQCIVSQYKKMLKLQIPRDQVLSRMNQEGVSHKIIVAVMGKRFNPSQVLKANDKDSNQQTNGPGSKLVSLHWTPLSGKDLDESVWSRSGKRRKVAKPVPTNDNDDFAELVELFQKKATVGQITSKKSQDVDAMSDKAQLLDLTRSNNIAISLKAFKDFSFDELAEIILYLDPDRKIQGERCHFVRDLLPTVTEVRLIKEFNGDDDKLDPAELWFRHVMDIPRIETKSHVLRTVEMFHSEATALMKSFTILRDVCNQVMKSEKLQDLLEMVLNIGNVMNEGTRTGGASGFKFDSLLRLTQTKSSDGKTTVLDFLVNVFVSKDQRDVLYLSEEFPDCRLASRMVISDLVKDVKSLGDALEECKGELEALTKRDKVPIAVDDQVLDLTAVDSSDLDDPRSALMTALKKTRTPEPQSGGKLEQGNALGETSVEAYVDDGDVTHVIDTMKEAGICRLRQFIAEETETFAELLQQREDALEACRSLSKYCGEGGGHGSTAPLLGVLAQFADNIDGALKKYDKRQKEEAKIKKQKQEVSSGPIVQTSLTSATMEAKEAKRSLVLMVNEMLKDANPRTREDFVKGRSYENPSTQLKAIYNREMDSVSIAAPSNDTLDYQSNLMQENGIVEEASRSNSYDRIENVRSSRSIQSIAEDNAKKTNTSGERVPALQGFGEVESMLQYEDDDSARSTESWEEDEKHEEDTKKTNSSAETVRSVSLSDSSRSDTNIDSGSMNITPNVKNTSGASAMMRLGPSKATADSLATISASTAGFCSPLRTEPHHLFSLDQECKKSVDVPECDGSTSDVVVRLAEVNTHSNALLKGDAPSDKGDCLPQSPAELQEATPVQEVFDTLDPMVETATGNVPQKSTSVADAVRLFNSNSKASTPVFPKPKESKMFLSPQLKATAIGHRKDAVDETVRSPSHSLSDKCSSNQKPKISGTVPPQENAAVPQAIDNSGELGTASSGSSQPSAGDEQIGTSCFNSETHQQMREVVGRGSVEMLKSAISPVLNKTFTATKIDTKAHHSKSLDTPVQQVNKHEHVLERTTIPRVTLSAKSQAPKFKPNDDDVHQTNTETASASAAPQQVLAGDTGSGASSLGVLAEGSSVVEEQHEGLSTPIGFNIPGVDLSGSRKRLSSGVAHSVEHIPTSVTKTPLQQIQGQTPPPAAPEASESELLRDLARRLSMDKAKRESPSMKMKDVPIDLASTPPKENESPLVKPADARTQTNESTFTKLARMKREEKSKRLKARSPTPNYTEAAVERQDSSKNVQQESSTLRLARQMRRERKNSKPGAET